MQHEELHVLRFSLSQRATFQLNCGSSKYRIPYNEAVSVKVVYETL